MRIYFTEGGNMFVDCVPINQKFPDFDGEEFVNESDRQVDSKHRVAVIITDGVDAIVGKSS